MPSFLDFCFELKNKEKAAITTMFRFEDHLTGVQHQPLRTPCFEQRMQHAFNIMAPEQSPPGEDGNRSWVIRHTTLYHSFDIAQGKSAWIIIKGNKLIRDRITSSEEFLDHSMTQKGKQAAQFASTLSTHLLILEWCAENWGSYIDLLEHKATRHAAVIKLAPVEALSRKPPKQSKMPQPPPEPRPLGIGEKIRSNLSRIASGLSTHQRQNSGLAQTNPSQPGEKRKSEAISEEAEEDENLDEHFSFDDLQSIRQITDEAEQASMIINENRRVISALEDRYSDLSRHKSIGIFAELDQDRFDLMLSSFCGQLAVLQRDFDSHDARLQLLLRGLERNEEMVSPPEILIPA